MIYKTPKSDINLTYQLQFTLHDNMSSYICYMHSLTGSILIDFEELPGSEEERDYTKKVYGAIKLQLSEMEKYKKVSHFNHCKQCNMVLTSEVLLPNSGQSIRL